MANIEETPSNFNLPVIESNVTSKSIFSDRLICMVKRENPTEPIHYKEIEIIENSQNKLDWIKVMKVEINNLIKNKVWSFVDSA